MESFKNQIITAIKKIRNDNIRSDAEKKSLKAIIKESVSNITLDDVHQNNPRCSQVPSREIHYNKVWLRYI